MATSLNSKGVGNLIAISILTVIALSIIVSSYLISSSYLNSEFQDLKNSLRFERDRIAENISAKILNFTSKDANVSISNYSPFPVTVTHITLIYKDGENFRFNSTTLNLTLNPSENATVYVKEYYPSNTTILVVTNYGNGYVAIFNRILDFNVSKIDSMYNLTIRNLSLNTVNITHVMNVTCNGTVEVSKLNLTLKPLQTHSFIVNHKIMGFYIEKEWILSPPINTS